MKLSTNTYYIDRVNGLRGAVDILSQAGFDAIDFSTFEKEFHTDAHDKAFYTEIKKYAEDKGMYFNQSHAPFASSYLNDAERTERRFGEIVNSMRYASYLGVRNIIVHPYQHLKYAEGNNRELLFEINMEFFSRLIPYCEEYGIHVAIENMWQRYKGTVIANSTCSSPEDMIRYVDTLNSEFMVCCLDIGHSTLVRERPDLFIKQLGSKRLKALHVHDVDGTNDSHTLPYLGIVDWDKVMKALEEIGYEGELTFEPDHYMDKAPKELIVDYETLLCKTGRYLTSKISL